jgi:hypothetical protein
MASNRDFVQVSSSNIIAVLAQSLSDLTTPSDLLQVAR